MILLFVLAIFTLLISSCVADLINWKALPIQELSILNVEAISDQEVCIVSLDQEKGPLLQYSTDRGVTWKGFPTVGNNAAVAISGDHKTLCVAGTRPYCTVIDRDAKEWTINELLFKTTARDVSPLAESGFAMVGLFSTPESNTGPVNGIAYTPDVNTADWTLSDIGLDFKEGYYALHGAFPSETTWYVTSGSWPIVTDQASNILSGKLYFVPQEFPDYKYEFYSLRDFNKTSYRGAISKTSDGGKSWRKVFDTKQTMYLNQIHCISEVNCVTVGEGGEETVILLTTDGGDSWTTSLKLSSDYSLYAVHMLSTEVIWVAGGMRVKNNLKGGHSSFVGLYYYTMNGGEAWDMRTGEGYVYDLSFHSNEVGYAATIFDDHSGVTTLSRN